MKTPNPGSKRVWRIYDHRGRATADLIGLEEDDPTQGEQLRLQHPIEVNTYRYLPRERISRIESLLEPMLAQGERLRPSPSIEEMRQRRLTDLDQLDAGVRRLINPHIYHVSLTPALWQLKQDLIRAHRGG